MTWTDLAALGLCVFIIWKTWIWPYIVDHKNDEKVR